MRQLHYLPIPEGQQNSREAQQLRQQLASAGLLDSDRSVVQRTSSDAPDETIEAEYRYPLVPDDGSRRGEMLAAELRELATSEKGPVPLFRRTGDRLTEAGYYNLDRASADPASPADRRAWSARAELTRAGTRKSHWRAISTTKRSITSPFGSLSIETVNIPDAAVRVRWFVPQKQTVSTAPESPLYQTAFGDLRRYTPSSGGVAGEDATLIYDIRYEDDIIGPRIYDGRGNAAKTDGDGIRQWQAVHATEHEFDGDIIVSTGRTRWRITQPYTADVGSDTVAEWNSVNGWQTQNLASSDWKPFDVDIITNTLYQLRLQVTYKDTTATSAPYFYTVETTFKIGQPKIIMYRPESVSNAIPTGIQNRYTSNDDVVAGGSSNIIGDKTLLSREATRR